MQPTTLYGLQQLVQRYRESDPDTLRMHPLIQYALLRDPEITFPGGRMIDRLAGCTLILDVTLPAGGWQMLHGDEQLAAGTAQVSI